MLKRASWVRNIIVFIKFPENWIQKSKIWINQGDWVLKDQFMMLSPYERTWSKKILFVRNQKSRTFIEIWMPWKSPFPFLSKVPNLRFLKNHKTEKSIFFYFGPILAQDSMDMKLGGFWADLAIFVDDFAYSLKNMLDEPKNLNSLKKNQKLHIWLALRQNWTKITHLEKATGGGGPGSIFVVELIWKSLP